MFSTYILLKHGTLECHLQGTGFVSFSYFTSTLKFKTHSQLTQSPFMGTDWLFIKYVVQLLFDDLCHGEFSEL